MLAMIAITIGLFVMAALIAISYIDWREARRKGKK
jgi:hypothetical protein